MLLLSTVDVRFLIIVVHENPFLQRRQMYMEENSITHR